MIWQGISNDGNVSGNYLLFQFIGLMIVGFATERLARRVLEKTTSRPVEVLSLGKRFDLACYGAMLGMVELGAFAVGAILFVEITGQQTEAAVTLWYQVIWCLLLIKLVLLAVRQVAARRRVRAVLPPRDRKPVRAMREPTRLEVEISEWCRSWNGRSAEYSSAQRQRQSVYTNSPWLV